MDWSASEDHVYFFLGTPLKKPLTFQIMILTFSLIAAFTHYAALFAAVISCWFLTSRSLKTQKTFYFITANFYFVSAVFACFAHETVNFLYRMFLAAIWLLLTSMYSRRIKKADLDKRQEILNQSEADEK